MIPFTKMHGIGNDYLYVDAAAHPIADPPELARRMSDRHRGIGADGLILLDRPSPGVAADVRMRMYNADGSESEMCGNGVRCLCKLAHDRGISRRNPMRVQTGAGVLSLEYTLDEHGKVREVTVDMGEPIWHADDVPVDVERLPELWMLLAESEAFDLLMTDMSRGEDHVYGQLSMRWVSMGNPHIVFFCRDVARIPLDKLGPMIERHPAFPRRVNAHFVQVHARDDVAMRTWERGSGITLACGTGAAAVCVVAAACDLTDRQIRVHLPGGDLALRWDEQSNHVFMTGPATEVFVGEWPCH